MNSASARLEWGFLAESASSLSVVLDANSVSESALGCRSDARGESALGLCGARGESARVGSALSGLSQTLGMAPRG